jgi:hypothetical protein
VVQILMYSPCFSEYEELVLGVPDSGVQFLPSEFKQLVSGGPDSGVQSLLRDYKELVPGGPDSGVSRFWRAVLIT